MNRYSAILLASVAVIAAAAQETRLRDEGFTFGAENLEGEVVRSSDAQFEGKVILVDIWGTWCPPCRKAIPELVKLAEKYREEGFVIVGIAFEREEDEAKRRELIREFAEKHDIDYVVLDGGETGTVTKALPAFASFRAYPTTVLIGRDGIVREVKTGWDGGDEKELEKQIQAALKE